MPKGALAVAVVILTAAAAQAQQAEQTVTTFTVGQLITQGYEIKAAAPNGSRYVVFMQKDKSAYACEFVNTTRTQCRQIN